MLRRQHFFESPLFLIAIFLILTTGLYFAFDYQGEVLDVILTHQYAFLAFGKQGGMTAYEIAKVPGVIKISNPEESILKIRKNSRRYPKLLLPEPRARGSFSAPGITASMGLGGGRIVVVNPLKGLSILDATNLDDLKLLGTINLAGANSVQVNGDMAFVTAGEAGMYVLDISHPEHIRPVYHQDTPGFATSTFVFDAAQFMSKYEISVSEQEETVKKEDLTLWVLIADGNRGVNILEIHPVKGYTDLGNIAVPGFTHNLLAWNNILFIAAGKAGLCMTDIISPQRSVNCVNTPGEALDLDEANGKIYVADGNAGLSIFSTGFTISSLQLLGHKNFYGRASSIAVGHEHAYLGSGKWGLFIIDVSTSSNPFLQSVIETPGEADPPLLIQSIFNPELRSYKVETTWKSLLRKTVLMAMLYIFSLALLAQFVLPIRDDQRISMLDYVVRFIARRLDRLIYIENGRMFRRNPETTPDWSKIVVLDRASGALIVNPYGRVRAIGPGVTFLKSYEKIARTLDLRVQVLVYGPEFDQEPFREKMDSETEGDYFTRKRHREETNAWTRDEVEIVATLVLDVQVRGRPLQGKRRYGFDPVHAYRVMAGDIPDYEDISPIAEMAENWQLALQEIVVNCWREHVKLYTFEQLFHQVCDDTYVNLEDTSWTNWQQLVQAVNNELTLQHVDKPNAIGQSEGSKIESLPYQKLLDFGLQVHSIRIVNLYFSPADEIRVADDWKKKWLIRAQQEKDRVDRVEEKYKQNERSVAQWGFAKAASKPLLGRIQGYGSMVERRLTLVEAANLLLDGTVKISRNNRKIQKSIEDIRRGLGV